MAKFVGSEDFLEALPGNSPAFNKSRSAAGVTTEVEGNFQGFIGEEAKFI
jgi:hypothetical protein